MQLVDAWYCRSKNDFRFFTGDQDLWLLLCMCKHYIAEIGEAVSDVECMRLCGALESELA